MAANVTLTAPRLVEPVLGQRYIDHLRAGHRWRALSYLLGKSLVKALDGLDGPVVRGINGATLAGAGFDAGTDMLGTFDDGQRIKQAHDHLGIDDGITESVVDIRMFTDLAVVAVGGIGNTLAAALAERAGATVPPQDQPKANAAGKLKFALSAAADATLLLGTIPKSPDTQARFKKAGTALLIGSVTAGAVSIYKYAKSTRRNLRLIACLNAEDAPMQPVHEINRNVTRRGIEGDVR
ncbi:hypothetical protein KC957_01330 [Candidatus Saccharibacteria bacterium]|nr:hypothetical protein [Candidatus Saccharibacteria bacterium]